MVLQRRPAVGGGERRRVRRGGFATAEAALAGLLTGEWLVRWLESCVSLRESTRRSYAAHIRRYLAPYLGPVPLAVLTAADVQDMFTAIARDEKLLGRPVSAATLHGVHATLRGAERGGPRRADRLEPRPVPRTAPRRPAPPAGVDPGPDAGFRVIALDVTTVAALRDHRARQQAEREAAGARWTETGYVFTTVTGKPAAPDRLTRLFRALVAKSGLPPVTLHGLRDGAATLALAAVTGLKVVQDQLGHSTITLTADTYTSVLPDTARAAAEMRALPRSSTSSALCGTAAGRRPSRVPA